MKNAPDLPLPHHRCPLCGGPNGCAPAGCGRFDVACWCTGVQPDPAALARVPESQRDQACLCRACLSGAVGDAAQDAPPSPATPRARS